MKGKGISQIALPIAVLIILLMALPELRDFLISTIMDFLKILAILVIGALLAVILFSRWKSD